MTGPWDKYAAPEVEVDSAGPWTKYSGTSAEPAQDWAATEMSPTDRLRAGIGRGMSAVGRAAESFVGDSPIGALNRAIHSVLPEGTPGRLPSPEESAAARDEAARLDAALLRTRGGNAGNFVGTAAMAAPALLIPGANTYAGSALIGAGTGAVTTEGDSAERLKGAGFGALGGMFGKAAGDALGAGVRRLAEWAGSRQLAQQTANAGRDAAVQTARQAGYTLPPTETRPNALNSMLEGLSGKVKTSQAASAQNQAVTNRLAKQAVGAPSDTPLTLEALNAIRNDAGRAYEAVASSGMITPSPKYAKALDAIVSDAKQAAKDFPKGKPNPLLAEIDALNSPQFDAASAVAKIRELRSASDAAYAQGEKSLGKGLKSGAQALEDAIEEHLKTAGPGLLADFKAARQLIAKTYSVEKSLNAATGDVSAAALAKQAAKGRPLSGELKTIADVGGAFPKATQTLPQNYNALSPLDYLAAIGTGNPLVAGARPGIRSLILSKPYQATMATPQNYGGANGLRALQALLENDYALRALPGVAAAASAQAGQQ